MSSQHHLNFTELPPNAAVLGVFGAAHLGDTMCTSPLPRLLSRKLATTIYVKEHPITKAVFEGNPYVAGFVDRATLDVNHRCSGSGHVLQRLQQGFNLPIGAVPKPELYLTPGENAWAEDQRQMIGRSQPICVISTSAVTDRGNLDQVDWASLVRVLSERYLVIQPVLSETPEIRTCVYRNLSTRRYMALLSIADAFVGGTSGGSHVAAAFDVPSLIISWRSMLDHLRFPVSGLGITAAFLYPQHWFIAAQDLTRENFREQHVVSLLEEIEQNGKLGRPNTIGNHLRRPGGIAPASAKTPILANNRFLLVPDITA